MKYVFLGVFMTVSAAFAHINPPPPGPSITGCDKWSGMTFCKDWYGPIAHTVSEASRCMANLGADDYVIYSQYRRDPNHPPVPFKKIFVRNCLRWIYGTVASNPMSTNMAAQVLAFIPEGAFGSNSHYTEEGEIKLYVVDSLADDAIYETTFDESGNLLEMAEIDPATDEYFLTMLELTGLEFALVVSE